MNPQKEPMILLDDITIKVDGGGVAFSLRSRDFKGGQVIVTYQDTTGTLSPGGHPGSYNGQDAYNDMLVTEDARTLCNGVSTGKCHNNEGGVRL